MPGQLPEIPVAQVDAVRRFNRFYTQFVGALGEQFLGSGFGLTPMRVLFQVGIAGAAAPTAAELAREIGLDKGQISRAVAELEAGGLIVREVDPEHGRRQPLVLTEAGRALYAENVTRQRGQIADYLAGMPPEMQARLTGAMAEIEGLLGAATERAVALREVRPGDLGWVVSEQTRLYVREYGWNGEYETLVLKILGEFAARQPAERERGWIAEVDGVASGAVFVMEKSLDVAQLRLLHVGARARGLGIGGKLVDQCLTFSAQAGYARIDLWTNDVLSDARKLYQSRGFMLVEEERHRSFGADLNGQIWRRML
ncbi:bifunctional helix-turn-helix transcriptional regulator/GNAT family N-acetyltransferase [Pseudooceanicola sp. C21-150M6]|uniref:bifunctional helix-turn-helix transcriptional regulator/GNAT family N-acetyltransferase n=1 Tax=Pseudooceanicola sp. C21-150M6 TaxID=3434355 RepID=UPI003D7F6129